MELTVKQRKKLERVAKVVESGELAITEHIFELEETLEEKLKETLDKVDSTVEDLKKSVEPNLKDVLEQVKGKDGLTPTNEELLSLIKPLIPVVEDGKNYILTSQDKKEIASSIKVPIVEKVIERTEVIKEQPIVTEITTEVENKDKPEEVRDKLSSLKGKERLNISAIEDGASLKDLKEIKQIAQQSSQMGSLPITTSFFNGLRAKNLTIVDGTAYQVGDTVYVRTPEYEGVQSIVAGSNVSVDATDPFHPIVSATAGASITVETPVGTVDGVNTVFTVSAEPKWVVSDGITIFSGAGYTYLALSITMDLAPSSFIRAII